MIKNIKLEWFCLYVNRADTTLKSLTTELQEFIAQRNEFSSLTVEGVSNFNQGVIFAQVKDDEALETLTAIRSK